MCGIPGLGKSTWLQNHKDKFVGSVGIVSRDQIRFSMLEDGDDYFSKEKSVWAKYVNDAIASLKLNENTVLDATHLNSASRQKILSALSAYLRHIEINIIYFEGTLGLALDRNENRKDQGLAYVPRSIIKRMAAQTEPPSLLKEDYIDKIITIDTKTGKIKKIEERE